MPESEREEELLRRVADASAVGRHLYGLLDEDNVEKLCNALPPDLCEIPGAISSALGALGHALDGTQGCLDGEEWEVKRRAHVVAYLAATSPAPLPESPEYRVGWPRVTGSCPMGCGESLRLAEGHRVTCTDLSCPNPTAVDEMLSPAAATQRQEEETEQMKAFERLLKHNEVVGEAVTILLRELKGSWWLRAAAAYEELGKLVVEPQEL